MPSMNIAVNLTSGINKYIHVTVTHCTISIGFQYLLVHKVLIITNVLYIDAINDAGGLLTA
jgi:hypothetical protein